jgi:hypothetical protein
VLVSDFGYLILIVLWLQWADGRGLVLSFKTLMQILTEGPGVVTMCEAWLYQQLSQFPDKRGNRKASTAASPPR